VTRHKRRCIRGALKICARAGNGTGMPGCFLRLVLSSLEETTDKTSVTFAAMTSG